MLEPLLLIIYVNYLDNNIDELVSKLAGDTNCGEVSDRLFCLSISKYKQKVEVLANTVDVHSMCYY